MNFIELGNRAVDLILGPKVEGEVILVLSDKISCDDIHLSRYAVRTVQDQNVTITVPKLVSRTIIGPAISIQNPEFSRGDKIKIRAGNIQPWNGQLI